MKFCVDVTKVCAFLGINAEQFNSLTVAEIEETKWGIKEAEIEERRNNEETMKDYLYFFERYETFVTYFGEELTAKYVPIVPLEELVVVENFRSGTHVYKSRAKLIGHGEASFPVVSGRGSRSGMKEYASADVYKLSSNYQGLMHNQIITAIFDEMYPWLQGFNLSIFELHSTGVDEFYVEAEEGTSLYVPYQFFVNGDIEGILNRNKDYLFTYANSSSAFEKLIETPTVKRFLTLVDALNK